ncbi:MAG: GNAT family N-acetyltransferase [Planctomyces sp.]|nr:GNAT family N-acetyltransferase [Planctomyces sp.]
MSSEIQIRPALAGDADVIARFNALLAWETEGLRLEPETVLAGVRTALADPAKGRYFVAEHSGLVVGQLMHTREWSDWRNGDLWWIQSVFVDEPFRGRGVFRALFDHLQALARNDPDVAGLRLYVEHANARAKAVYASLGLRAAHYEVLESVWRNVPTAGASGAGATDSDAGAERLSGRGPGT